MSSPDDLVWTLAAVTPSEYVRFVADWLTDASDLALEPPLTGNATIDALVAAATEHAAHRSGTTSPAWVSGASRSLDRAWWGGRPIPSRPERWALLTLPDWVIPRGLRKRRPRAWLFHYCQTTTPDAFLRHRIIISADSLTSI